MEHTDSQRNTSAVNKNTRAVRNNTENKATTASNRETAASNKQNASDNHDTIASLNKTIRALKGTVRLLVLLALFKLSLLAGMSYIFTKQQDQLDRQGEAITRTDQVIQRVTSDEATKAQQVIIYKIFVAQCEGRSINGTLERTGDKTIQQCADRLFVTNPQLPAVPVK